MTFTRNAKIIGTEGDSPLVDTLGEIEERA